MSSAHDRQSVLQVSPEDNLLVALRDLRKGEQVEWEKDVLTVAEEIPAKHKLTTCDLSIGDSAYMYGVLVGEATQPIAQGQRISTENLVHRSAEYQHSGSTNAWTPPSTERWKNQTFLGFERKDGSVGTANHWLVLPMVFCENGNVETLKNSMLEALGFERRNQYQRFARDLAAVYSDGLDPNSVSLPAEQDHSPSPIFPNVDGVKFLSHGLGCGETRGISEELCGLLAGYACSPNVGGITILSLGCQHAQVSIMEDEIAKRCPGFDKPLLVFEQQKYASEREMMEQAIRQTFAGLAKINQQVRAPAPLSKLCLGMECGASDGFSGISANPTMGRVADLLVGLGGRVILSEFPELCGVEQEIVNRCATKETGNRFIEIMRNYEARVKEAGSGFHMNPSPGNVKDGLITDAIKSAGAARKGGTSPVADVLDYPDWVSKDGLNLLCTAGNDVESTTAMAGAGANLLLFSTGLGTPTGNPISPVIKISSSTKLANSFSEYVDFDSGPIIDGLETVESLGESLLDDVIAYASGRKKTKASLQGRDDFLPWKRGMSL
jgi:altronate hydrolase